MDKEQAIKEVIELVLSLSTNSMAYQVRMVEEEKIEGLFTTIEDKLRYIIDCTYTDGHISDYNEAQEYL